MLLLSPCPYFHSMSRDSNWQSSGPELGSLILWLVLPKFMWKEYQGEEGKEPVKSFRFSDRANS